MINNATTCILILLAVGIVIVPKRYFLVPFVIAACFVPDDQRIIIMGLDFTVLRILVLAGVLRILLEGEQSFIEWKTFDRLLFTWAICGAVVYIIQARSMNVLINRCGILFDVIGLYTLFRLRIRSVGDLKILAKALAVCSLLTLCFTTSEWLTGQNPFEVLGRVTTHVRMGRYRCQGSFSHSIMFGLFWATSIPLFVGIGITENKDRTLYYSAVGATIFAVFASASTTPVVILLMILILLCVFKWRHYTQQVAIVSCLLLVSLHFALRLAVKRPIWYLMAKVNLTEGSTGWHRFYLVDQAIKHFREWAILGVRSTYHWGWGLGDVTNQYILEGVRGGLITLVLFLVMIFVALRTLLKCSLQCQQPEEQFLAWCFFAAIFGHCIAFLGVSYFGQIRMLWYLMLAVVGFFSERLSWTQNQAGYVRLWSEPGFPR